MARLPAVLSTDDLPLAELSALRCDGVLVRVGSCYTPVDQPDGTGIRAIAAAHGMHERMIAERMTAAWIWGARDEAPTPHQFCTDLGARVSHQVRPWLELREVVLSPMDIAMVGDLAVTTPARTLADLARFQPEWGPLEQSIAERLSALADDPGAVREDLERTKLPHKNRAMARLGISPS
ncbi:type IV toxin-antitoxin system AbiEi family antitoxin [Salinibacterium soli]|uniref:Type IV toxin-antitoxin system AbiEi family antitoxin n=1 Tax=Antiquaquibacter soli TaxID=3064523 RepID=A0ABT9BM00_9MICO|nr:type IV toxin-antitoxin system AbiEi family antitoxin [Protaetiibacter sp. WY-16]MDO7882043.1 type IV toxin-antitoxin system AbiEi family antitoxin [Protaetiibacter sp. WY-16]